MLAIQHNSGRIPTRSNKVNKRANMKLKKSKRKNNNKDVVGTLSRPSRDDSIEGASIVLARHILSSSKKSEEIIANHTLNFSSVFNIDRYIPAIYNVTIPMTSSSTSGIAFHQKKRDNKLPVPDQKVIHSFIKRIANNSRLHPEAIIISLIYIERLMMKRKIHLTQRNWSPIVMTALLAASKMWDDNSSFNAEFAAIIPIFSLKDVNRLERTFLTALDFEFFIEPSEYAKYYFGLRALRNTLIKPNNNRNKKKDRRSRKR
jgi:hypothetical protein